MSHVTFSGHTTWRHDTRYLPRYFVVHRRPHDSASTRHSYVSQYRASYRVLRRIVVCRIDCRVAISSIVSNVAPQCRVSRGIVVSTRVSRRIVVDRIRLTTLGNSAQHSILRLDIRYDTRQMRYDTRYFAPHDIQRGTNRIP